jgi:hypothetical protein
MENKKGEKKNWNNKCDFFANWGLLLYSPSGNVTLNRAAFFLRKKNF